MRRTEDGTFIQEDDSAESIRAIELMPRAAEVPVGDEYQKNIVDDAELAQELAHTRRHPLQPLHKEVPIRHSTEIWEHWRRNEFTAIHEGEEDREWPTYSWSA